MCDKLFKIDKTSQQVCFIGDNLELKNFVRFKFLFLGETKCKKGNGWIAINTAFHAAVNLSYKSIYSCFLLDKRLHKQLNRMGIIAKTCGCFSKRKNVLFTLKSLVSKKN